MDVTFLFEYICININGGCSHYAAELIFYVK